MEVRFTLCFDLHNRPTARFPAPCRVPLGEYTVRVFARLKEEAIVRQAAETQA